MPGATGPTGLQGSIGPIGPKGDTGPKGDPGLAAAVPTWGPWVNVPVITADLNLWMFGYGWMHPACFWYGGAAVPNILKIDRAGTVTFQAPVTYDLSSGFLSLSTILAETPQ